MSIEWVSVAPGRTEIGSDNRSILFGGIGPKHMAEISYRYSITKHPILIEEAEKIIQSKVLIIGMGGLGCPVAEFLTRAGVGTLGIVDSVSYTHLTLPTNREV